MVTPTSTPEALDDSSGSNQRILLQPVWSLSFVHRCNQKSRSRASRLNGLPGQPEPTPYSNFGSPTHITDKQPSWSWRMNHIHIRAAALLGALASVRQRLAAARTQIGRSIAHARGASQQGTRASSPQLAFSLPLSHLVMVSSLLSGDW